MTTPQFETLALSLDAHVALVELNRPEKANAMSAALWRELEECFRWCDRESAVRAVVLAGRGRHFCAGIDLAMFADFAPTGSDPARHAEQKRERIEQLQANLGAIERCRKPVLAAIHSSCIGGGVDMVCCADMRYCSEDAQFAIKEIDLGMVADVGTLQRMPRLVPDGLVRELAYTGRRMGAQEARSAGFVNAVFADRAALLEGVLAIARTIAERSPLAVRGTKELVLYAREHSVADGLRFIATWNAGMLSTVDVQRTIAAGGNPQAVGYED